MHFRSTGTLVWNAMETTKKNDVIVYLMCSINYEIKNIWGFHLTRPRMLTDKNFEEPQSQ